MISKTLARVKMIGNVVRMKSHSTEFTAAFQDIVRDISDDLKHVDNGSISKWVTKVLEYNIPEGKKYRSLMLIDLYKSLQGDKITPENLHKANIMGWCMEMFHGSYVIWDDIIDKSVTRRGKRCWHLNNNVGLNGINDGIMVQSSIYWILKKYFDKETYYTSILEIFHKMLYKTTVGQIMDFQMSQDKSKLRNFTMSKYDTIGEYKAAFYTFQSPVNLAMLMSGLNDPDVHERVREISLKIGKFIQVQDDYLDCFGDPSITGKMGTDIENGKCTWFAVMALQRANPDQVKFMEKYYGTEDTDDARRIKTMYRELNLDKAYAEYEDETHRTINALIRQSSEKIPPIVFTNMMNKLFMRQS